MYSNHIPLHHDDYYNVRLLPHFLSLRTPMFRYYGCRFSNKRSKEKTARVVMWREFGVTLCYTLETSFFGYRDRNRENHAFGISHFKKIGAAVGNSIERVRKVILKRKKKEEVIQEEWSEEESYMEIVEEIG